MKKGCTLLILTIHNINYKPPPLRGGTKTIKLNNVNIKQFYSSVRVKDNIESSVDVISLNSKINDNNNIVLNNKDNLFYLRGWLTPHPSIQWNKF